VARPQLTALTGEERKGRGKEIKEKEETRKLSPNAYY